MEQMTQAQHTAWRQAIAAQLKAERALRSLDQDDVCERSGISRSTYSRIERGAGATLDQLVTIANTFGLSLTDLIARTEAEMGRRLADPPAAQQDRKSHVVAPVTKRRSSAVEAQVTKLPRA